MTPPKFASIFVDVLTVRVQPKTLQSPPESANRYERQGHAKNSPHRPNIVKVSTMEEGDDEGEQRAVTGSLAFQGNRQGHGCHRAPWQSRTSRSSAGTDCATHEGLSPPNGCVRRAIACRRKASVRERTQARHREPTGEFVPDRQHSYFFTWPRALSRASTASLPETSSVTVTRTAGAEVSTLPIATTGSVALGSVVTS